jgi:hypothetical protein
MSAGWPVIGSEMVEMLLNHSQKPQLAERLSAELLSTAAAKASTNP